MAVFRFDMPRRFIVPCMASFLAAYPGVLSALSTPRQPAKAISPTFRQAATSVHAANDVQARLAAQNELFKEQWDDEMKLWPERATAYGDYHFNNLLSDYSLAGNAKQNATDKAYRARLAAISTDGFSDQDRLSHDLLLHVLDERVADYGLKEYEMPISQMQGVHSHLADLPNAVPLDTVQHYEDYVARLDQIPRALEQTIEVLRRGEKDGLMPPRVLLDQIPAQCDGIIKDDSFLNPTRHYPSIISPEDQSRLTKEIAGAVNTEVLPAYRHFANFIANEYAPHGRNTIGMSGLPNGVKLYENAIREQTTTDMTPAEIHALGLRELARINGLLTDLAHNAGYPDLKSFRTALNNDHKYVPKSADQIVDDFRHYVSQVQPRLPELFGVIPKAPLTVGPMPPSAPGNITHYIPGTPDGSRPARVVVATSDFAHRKLLSDETIAYHEGIPGHHLQISIQQQLKGLPQFRLHLIYNAYAEGWAVYSEALGKEIGFYQDPASDYGRLNTELMRAVRLVVDTGIHADGWTRDQAIAYFRDSGCADEPTIQAEVDRYIAWPAQGLSYKIGQLKILELRERAKQQLGPKFDVRAFHDEILSGGSLPLDVLQSRIDEWIHSQTTSVPPPTSARKMPVTGPNPATRMTATSKNRAIARIINFWVVEVAGVPFTQVSLPLIVQAPSEPQQHQIVNLIRQKHGILDRVDHALALMACSGIACQS
jgi:uncharacterized protein (DUF885 family)